MNNLARQAGAQTVKVANSVLFNPTTRRNISSIPSRPLYKSSTNPKPSLALPSTSPHPRLPTSTFHHTSTRPFRTALPLRSTPKQKQPKSSPAPKVPDASTPAPTAPAPEPAGAKLSFWQRVKLSAEDMQKNDELDRNVDLEQKYRSLATKKFVDPFVMSLPPHKRPQGGYLIQHPAINPYHPWHWEQPAESRFHPKISQVEVMQLQKLEEMYFKDSASGSNDPIGKITGEQATQYFQLRRRFRSWLELHTRQNTLPFEGPAADRFWSRPDVCSFVTKADFADRAPDARVKMLEGTIQQSQELKGRLKDAYKNREALMQQAKKEEILPRQVDNASDHDLIKQGRDVNFPFYTLFWGGFGIFMVYVAGVFYDFHMDYFGAAPMHPRDAFNQAFVALGLKDEPKPVIDPLFPPLDNTANASVVIVQPDQASLADLFPPSTTTTNTTTTDTAVTDADAAAV